MKIDVNVELLKANHVPYISKYEARRIEGLGFTTVPNHVIIVDDTSDIIVDNATELARVLQDILPYRLLEKGTMIEEATIYIGTREMIISRQGEIDFVRDESDQPYNIFRLTALLHGIRMEKGFRYAVSVDEATYKRFKDYQDL